MFDKKKILGQIDDESTNINLKGAITEYDPFEEERLRQEAEEHSQKVITEVKEVKATVVRPTIPKAKPETPATKSEPKAKPEPKAKATTPVAKEKKTEQDLIDELKSEFGQPRFRWNANTPGHPVIKTITHEQMKGAINNEIRVVEKNWRRMASRGGTFMNFSNPKFDPDDPRNPEYPTLNNHLRGMERGIICVAGQPNIGKTVWLSNVMHDVYRFNDKAIILDFILDDAIANRYVHLAALKCKRRYHDVQLMESHPNPIIERECSDALNEARTILTSGRFFSFERILSVTNEQGLTSYSVSKLQNLCSAIKSMREAFPIEEYPMVAFIDAYNNLDNTGISGCASDLAKEERAIDLLEEAANGQNVILFMTTHLRKESSRRVMSLEGIKGSVKLPYQAKVTFYLHNDLKVNREGSNVYWEDGDKGRNYIPLDEPDEYRKRPRAVLEVHNLKSKVSDENRTLYYRMAPERCGLYPPENQEEYEDLKNLASTQIVD